MTRLNTARRKSMLQGSGQIYEVLHTGGERFWLAAPTLRHTTAHSQPCMRWIQIPTHVLKRPRKASTRSSYKRCLPDSALRKGTMSCALCHLFYANKAVQFFHGCDQTQPPRVPELRLGGIDGAVDGECRRPKPGFRTAAAAQTPHQFVCCPAAETRGGAIALADKQRAPVDHKYPRGRCGAESLVHPLATLLLLVWSDEDSQFACPCHGSQYNLAGDYVAGPAPRAMDRYEVMAVDGNGRVLARSQPGQPLALPSGTEHVYIDPDRETQGASHA